MPKNSILGLENVTKIIYLAELRYFISEILTFNNRTHL